jgi:PEGA domain
MALWLSACATTGTERMESRAEELLRGADERSGDVELHCDPDDAEVRVDGVPQGRCKDFAGAPRRLSVGEGMHLIEVEKDGFWPYQTYFQPSGARAVLEIRLRPRGRAQGDAP